MKTPRPSSNLLFLVFIALLSFSHIAEVESKCVKRNFKYPTPSNKPVASGSVHAEQPSPTSSSSSKEEKEESSSSQKSSQPSSGSGSVSGSASGGEDTVDDEKDSKYGMFGDMLKQAIDKIDPNSPILNIPKAIVNDPEIVKMCQVTDYPDLCQSTVAHFVDGRHHDAVAMLEMVIKVCQQYTHLAMATARRMSESPFYARIKSRFTDIQEYYVDALDNLLDAANAIKARDIATVNINLSAALDDYGAYEDDWGETSPMADFNAKLTHMASNCLAVATLVKFK
ncbi:hypothetical protein QQ045_029280 [Rhodiola kirilowii]